MGSLRILKLSKEHAKGAADMHRLSFPGFFLSFLGRGFLEELYKCAACDDRAIGYVGIEGENHVVGACFGVIDGRHFFSTILRRRWWKFALHCIGPLLRRPSIIGRLLRALRFNGTPPAVKIHPLGCLMSTAVAPPFQGSGLAVALMRGQPCSSLCESDLDRRSLLLRVRFR